MADDLTLQFGAQTTDVDKGVASIKSRLDELSAKVESSQSAFQTMGTGIKDGFEAATEAIGGLDDAFKSLNDAIQKGGATLQTGWMKVLLGAGIGGAIAGVVAVVHNLGEEFIKMDRNATEAGISLQRFQELQYALNKSGAGTDKMASGLEEAAKKLNELNHDAGELGKFLDANNVKWKDAKGHIIDMNQYLNEAARLIANAATEGDRFKAGELLGFSKEWVRVLQGGPAALRQLSEEANKSGAVLNDQLVRRAADFEKEWNEGTLGWATKFKAIMADIFPLVSKLVNWLIDAFGYVTRIAIALGTAITEDFKEGLKNTLPDNFESRFSAINESVKSFLGGSEKANAYWKSTADEAAQMQKDLARVAENTFATGKAATVFPGKDEKFDPTALRELREQLDEVKEKYQQQKVIEQTSVDTFRETESQKVAHLRTALAEREKATEAIFAEEIEKYGDNAKVRASIERNFNKEMAAIKLEDLKLTEELLKKSTQEWESALGGITGAFNSQLRGLLAGTTTWAQAMKNIVADLVIKMIEEFEKLAIVKPLSGLLASSLSAPTELFAGLVKVIGNMFGPLMAGFTSFFAPTLGPAAPAAGAAAASAEVGAAVAAVGKFETGTDYVPRTGLALVHQGERIIPASQNAVGGSGVPAVNIAFNISAMDSNDVQKFFKRYGGQIAKQLNSYTTMNPSFS